MFNLFPRFEPPELASAPVWTERTDHPTMSLACPCGACVDISAASLAGVKSLAETFYVAHADCRGVRDV